MSKLAEKEIKISDTELKLKIESLENRIDMLHDKFDIVIHHLTVQHESYIEKKAIELAKKKSK